ncbi:PaaI family thioesterase [Thermodesulfobacteriota bacterium]
MEQSIKASFFKQIENESYAVKLGMRLIELEPGHAVVEMKPQEDTSNIFGMTHGGAIFSLIDEAFQASCNSHGTVAVALNVTVTYHKSPDRESTLRAQSREIHRSNKTATYKIEVTDEKDTLIASCLALAYRKGEKLPFLEEE